MSTIRKERARTSGRRTLIWRQATMLKQQRGGVEEGLVLDDLVVPHAPSDRAFEFHRLRTLRIRSGFPEIGFDLEQAPDDFPARHDLFWSEATERIGHGDLGGDFQHAMIVRVLSPEAKETWNGRARFPDHLVVDGFEERPQIRI